jgi:chromatin segregation and condensation protein Rec8/ScpA/Scc1 (kleisin family)
MRGAAAVGIAKKVYDVARRPENQERMRQAAERFRQRRAGGRDASRKAR